MGQQNVSRAKEKCIIENPKSLRKAAKDGISQRFIFGASARALAKSHNLYPHECAILSRARCSSLLSCSGCEAKDLLRCSSGQPIIQAQSWIALRCSGADPSAARKPCRNILQFAWLASGWRVEGVRWIANRDVYKWIQQLAVIQDLIITRTFQFIFNFLQPFSSALTYCY